MSVMESTDKSRSNDANYRGVRKRKWGKWVSEIRLPNSRNRIWLGSYDSPEKAARAFDAAQFCLRGSNANFNFPDQPPNIPGGTDLDPSQIQAAAAHFANSYVPPSSSLSSHELLQDPLQVSSSYTSTTDVVLSSAGDDINGGIPDFGIFPGFDDYFMPLQPQVDYEEEVVYDGVDSQDPSYLWNF
ncbi:hypothetical protein SSX86_006259 [Deinandra increscens subsp. villosa]|uniref:AP2/ERF domain-containing protein n=1 Tax=Deinandra increscens subsp. villosa TaxID=3103831 RepID=A0AAP0H8G4_9ASTR